MELSRVMRPGDEKWLAGYLSVVDTLSLEIGMHEHQHSCRRWEYAMALRALDVWREADKVKSAELVADWGCGVSLLPAILLLLGHRVALHEPWKNENQSGFVHGQMARAISSKRMLQAPQMGGYYLTNEELGRLGKEYDGRYDISFCISTLEHIKGEEQAFRQLCRTVRDGGLVFLTMDFADRKGPHEMDNLRERMYTALDMQRLLHWAGQEGCGILGEADWEWREDCRLVYDYGFASLALVKTL